MNDDNLDLLDLDDTASMDTLPEATQFAAPRPKKPWLLLGVGLLVIVLATYIIIRTVGGDSASSIDVDLDAPTVVVDGVDAPAVDINVPKDAVVVAPVAPAPAQPAAPAPVQQPQPQPAVQAPAPAPVQPVADATPGVPVRVVQDRKPVTFNPDKPAPVAKPAAKPAVKKPVTAKKPTPKPAVKKQVAAANGSWYVQFGSYSTRALAENAERKIRSAHSGLFAGKQFVILAAQLPNGATTYRLRIAFATSADANGFCRNAKSDGVDCYVAK